MIKLIRLEYSISIKKKRTSRMRKINIKIRKILKASIGFKMVLIKDLSKHGMNDLISI
jgi:hypothetical protein